MKKILIILALIIIILSLLFIIGRKVVNHFIQAERELFFPPEKNAVISHYSESQIENLPLPVKRYFSHVLRERQPYINSIHVQHDGLFKPDITKDWIKIEGEQYFTTETPGFQWVGKSSYFTAVDRFIAGEGGVSIYLLNLLKIVESSGESYSQGELLRWLGESVWFPTNLLPNENLTWSPLDEKRALLTYHYDSMKIYYEVQFNEKGEITEIETLRHMGDRGLQSWRGRLTNYQEIDKVRVPMQIEAIWVLEGIEYPYARFTVQNIEYR